LTSIVSLATSPMFGRVSTRLKVSRYQPVTKSPDIHHAIHSGHTCGKRIQVSLRTSAADYNASSDKLAIQIGSIKRNVRLFQ